VALETSPQPSPYKGEGERKDSLNPLVRNDTEKGSLNPLLIKERVPKAGEVSSLDTSPQPSPYKREGERKDSLNPLLIKERVP
jgi:hypothetical protein